MMDHGSPEETGPDEDHGKHGWVLDRTKGSHCVFVKEGRRPVPVPVPGDEIPKNLAIRILKEAGIE